MLVRKRREPEGEGRYVGRREKEQSTEPTIKRLIQQRIWGNLATTYMYITYIEVRNWVCSLEPPLGTIYSQMIAEVVCYG